MEVNCGEDEAEYFQIGEILVSDCLEVFETITSGKCLLCLLVSYNFTHSKLSS